jgi:hypothetical protein
MCAIGNPTAPAFVRFRTKADKAGFWRETFCPLMTQSGHSNCAVLLRQDLAIFSFETDLRYSVPTGLLRRTQVLGIIFRTTNWESLASHRESASRYLMVCIFIFLIKGRP